jgi:para-aminobenzoate synthetase component 1
MDEAAPLSFDAVPVPTPPGGPLAVELVPAPDSWDVVRRLAHLPHLLFLDSAEQHSDRGRYSYVAAAPVEWLPGSVSAGRSLLGSLGEKYQRRSLRAHADQLPPFRGGYAGLFGYGLAREFERIPPPESDEFRVADLAIARYESVVAFDHFTERAWLLGTHRCRKNFDLILSYLATPTPERMTEPARRVEPVRHLAPQHPLPGFPGVTSNFSRDEYEAAVRRAVEYIHAGDCFQVNLSQRLLAPLREHPLELYGRLRQLNPAPFAGYFDLGDFQILSASPERFLRVHPDGEVETRPIKGTRPRGATVEEDAALARELAASPKDRAENVMIVDLLRNDIGKVCEYGSVRVPRLCEVESFRFVHHLVSEVLGKLRPGLGPLDLLAAAFPGGSVTGAPKVRAMEIIAELEPTARGPYCGSLGWIGFDGTMDTNILIRTFTAGRGWVQFPVGGGIVADSDPAREYEETLHKAAGLLQALMKN